MIDFLVGQIVGLVSGFIGGIGICIIWLDWEQGDGFRWSVRKRRAQRNVSAETCTNIPIKDWGLWEPAEPERRLGMRKDIEE